jgi:pilus assembly protein CpaE
VIVFIDSKRDLAETLQEEIGADLDVEWLPNAPALQARLDEAAIAVEAVVFGQGIDFEQALAASERLLPVHPDLGVILLAESVSADDLRRALRAGVIDVLDDRRSPGELREAIDRSRARYVQLHAPTDDADTGRLVLVFSTKGGCGKSVIASNLAVALADRVSDGVALVDLALSSGDLSVMLQLMPAWTVYDAALQGPRLDQEALRGFLTKHQSGVHLLAAPNDPAVADQIAPEAVQHLLTLMRSLYPVTVIDTPAYFSEQVLAAIDIADEIILVASLDVPAVKNLKLALQTLEALHVTRDRIRIVMNRADSAVGLRVNEVEQSLSTKIDISVPSSRDIPMSVNQGTPLFLSKPRSSVVAALGELTDLVMQNVRIADNEPSKNRRRRGRR